MRLVVSTTVYVTWLLRGAEQLTKLQQRFLVY